MDKRILFAVVLVTLLQVSTMLNDWDLEDLEANCIHYCGNKTGIMCPPGYSCQTDSCGSECVAWDPPLPYPKYCMYATCFTTAERQYCPLGRVDMEGCLVFCGYCGRLWLVEAIEQDFRKHQQRRGINTPGIASHLSTSFLSQNLFIITFVTAKMLGVM